MTIFLIKETWSSCC